MRMSVSVVLRTPVLRGARPPGSGALGSMIEPGRFTSTLSRKDPSLHPFQSLSSSSAAFRHIPAVRKQHRSYSLATVVDWRQ